MPTVVEKKVVGHSYSMRFHRMSLSVIIIADVSVVVITDLLLVVGRHRRNGGRRRRRRRHTSS